MKRLIKKSEHDILNRDTAILYINNQIYEDVTHKICLHNFLKDNKESIDFKDDDLSSRPDFEILKELSNKYSNIILAHHVKKENGIFILYGFINGQEVDYNNIPNNIKEELANYYNLPVYNDLEHDNVENLYNEKEQIDKYKIREKQINSENNEEIINYLLNKGFYENNGFYVYKGNILEIKKDKINNYALLGGNSTINLNSDDIFKKIDNIVNYQGIYDMIINDYNATIEPSKDKEGYFDVKFNNESNTINYNFIASQGGFKLNYDIIKQQNFDLYLDLKEYIEDDMNHDLNSSFTYPELEDLYNFY